MNIKNEIFYNKIQMKKNSKEEIKEKSKEKKNSKDKEEIKEKAKEKSKEKENSKDKEEIKKEKKENVVYNQSQKHGFIWENEIREKIFGLKSEQNNTDKYDVPCEKNKFNKNENISIKTTKCENLDCADILRFYDYDFTKKNTIIVIKYEQKNNKKIIKKIIEINYNEKMRNLLFGDISKKEIDDYVTLIKTIPNGKASPETVKKYKEEKKFLQEKYNMKINISPKVDSKNQRRVQCSIPNIFSFLEKNKEFIISQNEGSVLRNVEIQQEIESMPRVRNKK